MNWQEKLERLKEIALDVTLHMRKPGDWYVSVGGVEIRKGQFLSSPTQTGCATPAAAVTEAWRQYTQLPNTQYLVSLASTKWKQAFRYQDGGGESVDE